VCLRRQCRRGNDLNLVSPQTAVQDVTIRGGTFAATNVERDLLVTRLSSDPT
jgi:hypothetical protein